MAEIIDSLLLLASVRNETVQRITIDCKHIAEEAITRLDLLIQTKQPSIRFIGDWPNAIGQAQWVEEVWTNYISNAIKYGGEPANIELGATELPNGFIKFYVKDDGQALSPDQANELFVQFSRLAPHKSEGHGLGLSIVKRIITRLGGEVGYEAIETGGSLFWFSLPSADKD